MMKIMNAVPKRDNFINIYEDQAPDVWNNYYPRNNQILSKRKLARFVASLICQTHEIEHKLKAIAEQKFISATEQERIKKTCEVYEQMLALIKEWKNLHFQSLGNREIRNHVNPWSQQISTETRNKDTNLPK